MADWQLSAKHYLKAIQLDPDNPTLLNNYAVLLYDKLHDFDTSIIYYKKSVQIDDDATVYCNLCQALVEVQKYDESIQYWHKSI